MALDDDRVIVGGDNATGLPKIGRFRHIESAFHLLADHLPPIKMAMSRSSFLRQH